MTSSSTSFRPSLEPLGERIQPSVAVINGVLKIDGTSGADAARVGVSLDGRSYVVDLNGTVSRFALSQVSSRLVTFYGYAGNDFFTCVTAAGGGTRDLQVLAYGMEGDDRISGSNRADNLNGGAGLDTIFGNGGGDKLDGGGGEDYLFGRDGGDLLIAGSDDSYNYLHGGGGNDTLHGGHGFDYMVGDSGNDLMYGYEGNDHMSGGSGDDVMHGNAGDDFMHGGTGYDVLFGKQGDDTLNGGGDDDVRDRLFGGVGRDTFQWEHHIDDGLGLDFNPPLQEIEDFQFGIDIEV